MPDLNPVPNQSCPVCGEEKTFCTSVAYEPWTEKDYETGNVKLLGEKIRRTFRCVRGDQWEDTEEKRS